MKTSPKIPFGILSCLMLLLLPFLTHGQPPCTYGSFEDSSFGNWMGESVKRYLPNLYQYTVQDFVNDNVSFGPPQNGHHVIMSPYNGDYVPYVPAAGGSHSIQLGDYKTAMNWTDKISMTTQVTDACFSFLYALVMQNHPGDDGLKPFFMFRVRDSSGSIIDSLTYLRVGYSTDSFFTPKAQNTVLTRNWTVHRVNMAGLIGHTVTLEFIVSDCGHSSHYGYAYLDNICFGNCCNSCETLFYTNQSKDVNHYLYSGSTDSSCCYQFGRNWFMNQVFKCSPYGIHIYDYNTRQTIKKITGSVPLLNNPFDYSQLDVCFNRNEFSNGTKTIAFGYLDINGEEICTGTQVLEACYSDTCNCATQFPFPDSLDLAVPIKDTSTDRCCFYVKYPPYTCPIYGLRVYHADSGTIGHPYAFLDFVDDDPIHQIPGPPPSFHKFCVDQKWFTDTGMTVRIEYLDAEGRIICARNKHIECKHACCDSMVVKNEPFNGCSGKIFFGIPSGRQYCGIVAIKTGYAVMGDPRPGYTVGFMLPYSLSLGETRIFTGYFINEFGDTICSKSVKVTCSCCDSMVAINEPAEVGGECSGKIFFGIPSGGNSCGIVSMKLSHAAMGDPRPGYSLGLMIPYCLTTGQTVTYTAYFTNSAGDTVCHKSITISCPGVSCCDAVKITLISFPFVNPNTPGICCFYVYLNANPCYLCPEVYNIKLGNILLSGHNIMSSIPPLGAPPMYAGIICKTTPLPEVTDGQFTDSNNHIICHKPIELADCRGSKPGPGEPETKPVVTMANPLRFMQVYPNPAGSSVSIMFAATENDLISLQLTDITGRVLENRNIDYKGGLRNETINTGLLQNGVYFIRLGTQSEKQVQKLVIRH